jgi:hypothetical protein
LHDAAAAAFARSKAVSEPNPEAIPLPDPIHLPALSSQFQWIRRKENLFSTWMRKMLHIAPA